MASSARRRPGQSRSSAKRQSGLFKQVEAWLRSRMRQHRYQHVFQGQVKFYPPNNSPGASGFHHRFQGQNPPGARVRRDANGNEMITQQGPDGIYRARVDVQAPNGTWIPKNAQSTFFPDRWTPQQVDDAISNAFRNRTLDPGNSQRWYGPGPNGMMISGFVDPGSDRWKTAFPLIT